MTDYAQQFRDAITARNKGRRPGGRYSRELRHVALQHLHRLRLEGRAATIAARDLGIDPNTLRGWEKRDRVGNQRSSFRPVEIVDNKRPRGPDFVVIGPAGLRVECSDASRVAALFRALA